MEMVSNPEGSNSQNIEEMEAYSQVPNLPPRSVTTISTDSATYPEGSVDLNSKDRERSENPMSGFGEALDECEGEPRASDAWPDLPKSMADFVTKGKLGGLLRVPMSRRLRDSLSQGSRTTPSLALFHLYSG